MDLVSCLPCGYSVSAESFVKEAVLFLKYVFDTFAKSRWLQFCVYFSLFYSVLCVCFESVLYSFCHYVSLVYFETRYCGTSSTAHSASTIF